MAYEIRVPIVLAAPTKQSEDAALASIKKLAAEESKAQGLGADAARAKAEEQKRLAAETEQAVLRNINTQLSAEREANKETIAALRTQVEAIESKGEVVVREAAREQGALAKVAGGVKSVTGTFTGLYGVATSGALAFLTQFRAVAKVVGMFTATGSKFQQYSGYIRQFITYAMSLSRVRKVVIATTTALSGLVGMKGTLAAFTLAMNKLTGQAGKLAAIVTRMSLLRLLGGIGLAATLAIPRITRAGRELTNTLEETEIRLRRLSPAWRTNWHTAMEFATATSITREEAAATMLSLQRLGLTQHSTMEGLYELADAAKAVGAEMPEVVRRIAKLDRALRILDPEESTRAVRQAAEELSELGLINARVASGMVNLTNLEFDQRRRVGMGLLAASIADHRGLLEEFDATATGISARWQSVSEDFVITVSRPFDWMLDKLGIIRNEVVGFFNVLMHGLGDVNRFVFDQRQYLFVAAAETANLAPNIAPMSTGLLVGGSVDRRAQPLRAGIPEHPDSSMTGAVWQLDEPARQAMEFRLELQRLTRTQEEWVQAQVQAAAEQERAFEASTEAINSNMAAVIAEEVALRELAAAQEASAQAALRTGILGHPGVDQATEELERYRTVLGGLDGDWRELDPDARTRAWDGYVEVLQRAQAAGVGLTAAERELIDYHKWYTDAISNATTQTAAFTDQTELLQYLTEAGILTAVKATETTTAWDHALASLADTTGGPVARALRQHMALVAGIELAWRKVSEGTADSADLFLTQNDRMLTGLSLTAVGFQAVADAASAMSAEVGAAGRAVGAAAGILGGVAAAAPAGPVGMVIGGVSGALSALTDALGANTAAQRAAVAAYERGLEQARSTLGIEDVTGELRSLGALWFGGSAPDGTLTPGLGVEQRKRGFMRFGAALQRGHEAGVDFNEIMSGRNAPLGGFQAEAIRQAYLWTLDLIKDIRTEEARRLKVINKIADAAVEEARVVKQDLTNSYRAMTGALRGLAEAADSAFDVRALDTAIARMQDLGLITAEVANAYRGLADAAHIDWRRMGGLAEQFGIGEGHLGRGYEQARVSGLGGEIAGAFRSLTDGGGDPLRVAVGLLRTALDESGEETGEGGLLNLIQRGAKSGAFLPPELKPALDALAAAGIETESISQVKYGDPLGAQRKSLHELLAEVSTTVHDAAIEQAQEVIEGIEELRDAQLAAVREQTDRLVAAIESGNLSPEDIAAFLGPGFETIVDGILRSAGLPAAEPSGEDFTFDTTAFSTALGIELAKLTPNPEQWTTLVDAINAKHGLDQATIDALQPPEVPTGIDVNNWPDGFDINNIPPWPTTITVNNWPAFPTEINIGNWPATVDIGNWPAFPTQFNIGNWPAEDELTFPSTFNIGNIEKFPVTFNLDDATIEKMPVTFSLEQATINKLPVKFDLEQATIDKMPTTFELADADIEKLQKVDVQNRIFDLSNSTIESLPVTFNLSDVTIGKLPVKFDLNKATIDEFPVTFSITDSSIEKLQKVDVQNQITEFDLSNSTIESLPVTFNLSDVTIGKLPVKFDLNQTTIDLFPVTFNLSDATIGKLPTTFNLPEATIGKLQKIDVTNTTFDLSDTTIEKFPVTFNLSDTTIEKMPVKFDLNQTTIDLFPLTFNLSDATIGKLPVKFDLNQATIDLLPVTFNLSDATITKLDFDTGSTAIKAMSDRMAESIHGPHGIIKSASNSMHGPHGLIATISAHATGAKLPPNPTAADQNKQSSDLRVTLSDQQGRDIVRFVADRLPDALSRQGVGG